MNDSDILVLTNTFLLSIVSIASLLISFFLKDLYQDYKNQADKVNDLHRKLDTHSKLFEELMHIRREQIERLQSRLDELELRHRNERQSDRCLAR